MRERDTSDDASGLSDLRASVVAMRGVVCAHNRNTRTPLSSTQTFVGGASAPMPAGPFCFFAAEAAPTKTTDVLRNLRG